MAQQLTDSRPHASGSAVVALLEAAPSELKELLQAHGAAPIALPTVSERLYVELEEVRRLIDDLAAGTYELLLFMSGGAVSSLFECAHELGRRADLLSALRALTVACRGPKATAGLRRFGLYGKAEASAPLTTSSLMRALQQLDLTDKSVLRINGEQNDTLAKSLAAQGAKLHEVTLEQRRSPRDTAESEALLRMIVGGGVQALVVSCEIQFLHLYQVARRLELAREFIYALRKHVTVAALGTSSRDILEAHGVRPHSMPAPPQALMPALLHLLDTHTARGRGAAGPGPLASRSPITATTTPIIES